MFWEEGEHHRLRLELRANAADAEGASRANTSAQGPARVLDYAWAGGYLAAFGYQTRQ
jgi:hypothetical protein